MPFNWDLKVPAYYQGTYLSLRSVARILEEEGYEWATARRHLALMHARGGSLGPGGTWRTTPHPVSLASQRGQSFHQDQDFANGHRGPAAIDYVWMDGPDAGTWHDGVPTGGVPVQGTPEALTFGIHANVGTVGTSGFESWHGQPIEIDGWGSATGNGSHPAPAIDPNYILPANHNPDPEVETEMKPFRKRVYDSRKAGGRFKKGETRRIEIGKVNAALLNVQAIQPSAPGYIEIWPGGTRNLSQSVLAFGEAGGVVTTVALVDVGADGYVSVFTLVDTDLVLEIQGVI